MRLKFLTDWNPLENATSIMDALGFDNIYSMAFEILISFINCLKFLLTIDGFKELMSTSKQGTLSERLLFLENNIRAKTGTLSKMSGFVGTLKTMQNKDILFCILTQNSSKRKAILKNFENTLVGLIYRKY